MIDISTSLRAKEIYNEHSEVLKMWETGTDAFKRALAKTVLEIAGEA